MTRVHQVHSRQGNIPDLEDPLLRHAYDRLIPAITINKMKLHGHSSTSTTLLLGSGHDLQLISRVPPCSLKHIDTSCSLQHIDGSTICSGHAPPRTDDSYHLQSCVLPEPHAPKATSGGTQGPTLVVGTIDHRSRRPWDLHYR
ncbi:hypothetical protein F2Q69_00023088 [Brassica cretica]|uniref:Uncharacterized protein n=1 Tax=Brassica cretica TaxID=69181 RepID=A0A8S9QKQ0_BRACR|nr:hypothetical protein F2Q69_00023088 [Brassica cretica]